jgi:2'-5' RNA ligase
VEVVKNTAIDSLQNSFTEYLLLQNKYPLDKDNRPFHPHVTIATRDLYKKAFQEAWEIFSPKEYNAEWKIDSISLLRHNKKNWDVILTSQFLQQ